MSLDGPDDIASITHKLYSTLAFRPPPGQYTILASFILVSLTSSTLKVISLATGSKCLPTMRLPRQGDSLHDSHAEVLARRGAVRWILEEIGRLASGQASEWIERESDGHLALNVGVRIHMYISTVPCGDASTRFLASFQDEEMAALKDSTVFPALPGNVAARGRDNYSLYGVLRTKPGRADSPPTLSMSCSDKIAAWNVLGIQGALGSQFLRPLYVDNIVIGEVSDGLRSVVLEDCERALWKRIGTLDGLHTGFQVHQPTIQFTSPSFIHSRSSLASVSDVRGSCNDSLCWIADSPKPHEVLVNGLKRGVSPKHRHKEKFRPQLSKISMFQLYEQTLSALGLPQHPNMATYYEVKHSVLEYQATKRALTGEGGPFSGWVKSGVQWESFYSSGECRLVG